MSSLLAPWTRPRDPSERPLLAVGTMNFGKRTPEAESIRLVHHALDRGLTLFDTANAYVDGNAERILGKALADRRDKALVATKVGFGRIAGKPEGLSRARVLAAIDESLGRLGMEFVDVYYLHVPDYGTPLAETLDAVQTLLASGKIRAWAVSNYASWQVLEMFHLADQRGMPRPVMSQVLYNVLIRQLDIEYFRFARKYKLHSTVYNPLAGGLLSGKHAPSAEPPKGSRFEKNPLYQRRYWTARFFELVSAYREVAESQGMTLVELAYAYLVGTRGVDSILVGPGSIEHLDAAIDACAKVLPDEAWERIDVLYRDFQGTNASYAR
ncbi:aldo/keto reductase [Polyangium sorediatum]|uniref:Aldo/keto reductase n=1 Tax=Polyangium sorediatum TaxID=889274 RepID=A0ABT6P4U3_9BACT|nr:aldo/keto reductase [Polyangium sorediatum]MDI1435644.1 aldo/keto reductase [Polyangium sorediatum]